MDIKNKCKLFTIVGKEIDLDYLPYQNYGHLASSGICVYDCPEMVGIRCRWSGCVTLVSKSIIKSIRVTEEDK